MMTDAGGETKGSVEDDPQKRRGVELTFGLGKVIRHYLSSPLSGGLTSELCRVAGRPNYMSVVHIPFECWQE